MRLPGPDFPLRHDLASTVSDEVILQRLRFGLAVYLARDLPPLALFELREVGIALHRLPDLGEVKGTDQRQGLGIELGPPRR